MKILGLIYMLLQVYFLQSTGFQNGYSFSSKKSCHSKYRSYDGSCNNIWNPQYGAFMTVQPRLRPAVYDDNVSSPRTHGKSGDTLPSARHVAQMIHAESHHHLDSNDFSLMLMQWGQFLDHDIDKTPIFEGDKCATCTGYNPATCFPIPLSDQDSFFRGGNAPKCMPFIRSQGQMVDGKREQINKQTSFIDASQIYGPNDHLHERLRDPIHRHLLKSSSAGYEDMLPLASGVPMCRAADGQCFLSGDERTNITPGETMLHTVFHRLHNIIAKQFAEALRSLTQEEVFEETRRLVAAIMQHITFNEYLPRVLGSDNMNKHLLQLHRYGYNGDYSSSCNAAIVNEFSTAAYRFGHSQIQPVMFLLSNQEMISHARFGSRTRDIHLRHHFNNPEMFRNDVGAVEDLIRGLVSQPMANTDKSFSREVTNHLNEQRMKKFSGLDLVALNIQRGRDHGIQGYNVYREFCGLMPLYSFHQTQADIQPHILVSLSGVYQHPDDVDLFTGIMSETQMAGSMVGPTLSCLLSLQFRNLKKCDRFWYETDDMNLKFSEAQLSAIREVRLSSVLCLTGHGVTKMTRSAMDMPDEFTNPLIDCNQLGINLKPWIESKRDFSELFQPLPILPKLSVQPNFQFHNNFPFNSFSNSFPHKYSF